MASSCVSPQTATSAEKAEQTFGRSGLPKIEHKLSGESCTQRTPAGLPCGMPGIGELIEGAIQQAPQPARQSMGVKPQKGILIYSPILLVFKRT
ncbi:protein of unknown function [Pseudomonas marincola]|uniref:Uncharacterized protein n=1 Tax=Pseudomonas marincola TaxID=437900 RepID=A0A8S2BDT0_9PSED|nr:protein of unknown function [Pseudomonas marincola]